MKAPRSGFTLLEVLIAVIVVTIGLLALTSTLGLAGSLAGQGRAQSHAAILLQSRADLLRQEVLAGRPSCAAPPGGSRQLAPAVLESWATSDQGGVIELVIRIGADTLITRVACR